MRFIPLPSTRGGRNVFQELQLIYFLFKTYKREKPDIVHHVTIKPILYGSIVAKLAKVPKVINAVSGLGSHFIDKKRFSLTSFIIRRLYYFSFNYNKILVIVQNNDDKRKLLKITPLSQQQIVLIKGSGVDLKEFAYASESQSLPLKIVLPSRMIKDKGIFEFVEAATSVKAELAEPTEFILAGKVDAQNTSSIPEEQLTSWNKEGIVQWIGHQKDMIATYQDANLVVLPSYREGLPKSLIEACAIGRAIVTTDVPGCRDVVSDGENGYLVPPQSATMLAEKIKKLVLDADLRQKMGKQGRRKAELEFSIESVVEQTLLLYKGDN